MKRFLVAIAILCTLSTTTVFAQNVEYKVYVDSDVVEMDSQPSMYRNSTFVPISFIAKELGATVDWASPNVTIKKGDTTLVLTVGSNAYTKNGETFYTQYKPFISNGRTYVPLRFVSNAFGYPVTYDETNDWAQDKGSDYTITKNIRIDTTKTAKPDNTFVEDNSTFTLSPNGKYGYKAIDKIVYYKNIETGEFKEVYSTSGHFDAYWVNNNKLVLSGYHDENGKDGKAVFLLYDPTTDKLTKIVDAYYGFYYEPTNSFMYSTTVYASDGTTDEGSKFYSKDMSTGKVTEITKDKFYEYKDLERDYRLANY